MITNYDRKLLTEAGRDYILEITKKSQSLKEGLSLQEYYDLCDQVKKLTYEEVISLTITEDIREFEGKFSKFLKYGLAAIAGGFFGGIAGPPVAMFALYLYRKATDTCVRSCFRKLPLSKERKVCKYSCQLNAAKKMVNDIRSEVSKCSSFRHSAKCEKKLQGEYIKWAKRVQMLTVKLNKARVDAEEKIRKARGKELAARAKSIAGESISINDKSLVSEDDGGAAVGPIRMNPKHEKAARMVATIGLFAVPVPGMSVAFLALVKKFNAACHSKCLANREKNVPHNVCYTQCSYMGAKYAVQFLNKELPKCNKSSNPTKCKKKIYNMLEDWKQREVERKIKFETTLRKEIAKARDRNSKQGQQ
jgi:hypothetical protein